MLPLVTTGCNSWFGHKWAKWSKPEEVDISSAHVGFEQRRVCVRCGMEEVYAVTRLQARAE